MEAKRRFRRVTSRIGAAAIVGLGVGAWGVRAEAATLTFFSDQNLPVNPINTPISTFGGPVGVPLGSPQRVCLTPTIPSSCSPPATSYNYSGRGFAARWTDDLTLVNRNAKWIWAPGVTGTTPADADALLFFQFSVTVPEPVVSASIFIAVDDFAQVIVNGTIVGTAGSDVQLQVAQDAATHPTIIDLTRFVHMGVNTFSIEAINGFTAACPGCAYRDNPAGVVFCGFINTRPPRRMKPIIPIAILLLLAALVMILRQVMRGRRRRA